MPEKEACRDWECAQTSGLLDCIKAEGISTIGTEILTFVAFLFDEKFVELIANRICRK